MQIEDLIAAVKEIELGNLEPEINIFDPYSKKKDSSRERWEEYERLYDEIGILGMESCSEEHISFRVSEWKTEDNAGHKGIIWMKHPQEFIEYAKGEYKQIEDNWYIYTLKNIY